MKTKEELLKQKAEIEIGGKRGKGQFLVAKKGRRTSKPFITLTRPPIIYISQRACQLLNLFKENFIAYISVSYDKKLNQIKITPSTKKNGYKIHEKTLIIGCAGLHREMPHGRYNLLKDNIYEYQRWYER